MAALRNHWMRAVDATLLVTGGMRVNVGDDFEPASSALFPDNVHSTAVENYTALQAIGIDVVIRQVIADRARRAVNRAEQECSGLPAVLASPAEVSAEPRPQAP